MRVAFLLVMLLWLRPAAAAVQILDPADGAVVRGSSVTLMLHDDDGDAGDVTARVNGVDVSVRLRGTGGDRSVILAGVSGGTNPLRRGRNHVEVRAAGTVTTGTFTWRPKIQRVHLIVVGNELDFAAYESFATWQAEVDRIFETLVRPRLVRGRPNVVVLTEDFGLPAGLLGSRGATTRAAKDADPLTALSNLFVAYATQSQYYQTHFTLPGTGIQPFARALILALTDTLWRAAVPVLSAKAQALGVYLVACSNVAPAHRSTDAGDVAMFGDVDDPGRTDVFLPDGIDVYNTAFLWGPDGQLVGTTRKVNLTPPEIDILNLSNGAPGDVQVFDTPAGRIGIAISLDAFIPEYVHRLDDLGATLVLQPDANPGLWATPPGEIWQPDEWTESVLGMLRADLPNLTYNATSMMAGNFFPGVLDATGHPTGILFDGQSTVTKRTSHPPRRSFVAMAPGKELTILGQPLLGEFVAVSPWIFPDPGALRTPRQLADLASRCATTAPASSPRKLSREQRRQMLYDCAKTLLPGGANAGGYRESVVTADVPLPVAP